METWLIAVVTVLGLLFVVSNVVAVWAGTPNAEQTKRAVPWLQRSTSAQLAIIAWVVWGFAALNTPVMPYALWIAIGMTVSFVADLIMAEIIRVGNRVIGGMVAFAIAHLCYVYAFATGLSLFAPRIVEPGNLILSGSLIGMLAVGFVVWGRLVFNPDKPRVLNYGALGYTLVISVMVGFGLSLAIGNAGLWMAGAGAVLFMVSDVLLGNQIFRDARWRWVSEWVWGLYISGQALIVGSVVAGVVI